MPISSRWRDALLRFLKEWALAVVIGVAALWACAKVGEDVLSHESTGFDNAIETWVAAHQMPLLSDVFLAITYAGSVGASLVTALVAAVWLWRARGRRIAAATLVAPAVATMLFVVLKRAIARARPAVIGHLALRTYSFPSGHSTASAAVWCTLAYITWREGLTSRKQAIWIGTMVPLLVGISRIYLGVHWATDVLGGWSLGVLIAVMGAVLYDRSRLRHATVDEAAPQVPKVSAA